VEHFRFKLGQILTPDLAYLVKAEWVPWEHLRLRHRGEQDRELVALFEAYQHIQSRLPVTKLSETPIPVGSDRCRMCGTCCSIMRPGAVSARTFRAWDGEGKLIADFFYTAGREDFPTYICWIFQGSA
jgi:hypothetical protein